MRKLQLRIASFIQNQGIAPSPRKSRLKKAALTFLVAASVAFFGGAPAGAIEITAMTPSSSETIAGDRSHYIMLYTDVGYSSVQWFVAGVDGKDKHVRTNTGSRLGTFDYLSSYDYAGLGSTTGNKVTVKAVAYRNAGNLDDHDTETVEITVWDPIRLSLPTGDRGVEGEKFTITARTNIPASHVIFTIGGGKPIRVENGGTFTRHSHTFGKGSREGVKYTISAVAYATVAGKEISDDDSYEIIVYTDLGFIWRFTGVDILSIDKGMGDHWYVLKTSHYLAYYNDTGKVQAGEIFTNLGWAEGVGPDKMGPFQQSESVRSTTKKFAYYWMDTVPRTYSKLLTQGIWYSVMGYTRAKSGNDSTSARDSGLGVEYDDVNRNLPPTGQYDWNWNEAFPLHW